MTRLHQIDRQFFLIIAVLTLFGFFIFVSASLGLLAREGARFGTVTLNQAFLGLFLGSIALIACIRVPYLFWRRYALYLFITALVFCVLVFIPGLGVEHGGAKRWINIGPLSFQPAEFLKFAFIVYFAAWASGMREKIKTLRYGILPFLIMLGAVSFLLLLQPNTSTLAIILAASIAMFFAAGGRWLHISGIVLIALLTVAVLALTRPYVRERVLTFVNPASDPLGASYQVRQSLIAIGSGGFFGRGPGQSIQKFDYLPEPVGDSIFAVAGEEFGFIGGALLIILFVLFAYRGFGIAARAPDRFGGLLVIGIVIMVVTQSFVNIGAMLGMVPLTGTPLLFVSKGGTALFFTLAEMGIILNVSRYRKGL
jgi:cell division protein FtsW